jgi:hypothetical protein
VDKPVVVRLPDGTHWLVHRGRGHQIRGDRFLFWAKAMYGVEERAEPDWEAGEADAAALFGGPGGIEQVAKGEAPDPLGYFGVQSDEAIYPYADAKFVKVGDVHYLVLADGRGFLASGPGQIAALTAIHGAPVAATSAPPVFGSVSGEGPNDLFRPQEIEVFSGTPVVGVDVDATTDDDGPSINLPPPSTPGPINPEAADPNAPSVREQAAGASGDRTPGLAMPNITVPPPIDPTEPAPVIPAPTPEVRPQEPTVVPPGAPIPAPTPDPRPIPVGAPGHAGTPHQRPDAIEDPYQRPDPIPPAPGRFVLGGEVPAPGRFIRGVGQEAPGRFVRGGGAAYQGSPAQTSRVTALRPLRQLDAPAFPTLRRFLEARGGDVGWLNRVEGR